jgi:hypothetical protein
MIRRKLVSEGHEHDEKASPGSKKLLLVNHFINHQAPAELLIDR